MDLPAQLNWPAHQRRCRLCRLTLDPRLAPDPRPSQLKLIAQLQRLHLLHLQAQADVAHLRFHTSNCLKPQSQKKCNRNSWHGLHLILSWPVHGTEFRQYA